MTRVDDLFRFIERYPDEAVFAGPTPPEAIVRAEEALGVRLPPSYRAFLERYGAGGLGGQEFCGLTRRGGGFPDTVWSTRRLRDDGLPSSLVAVEDGGIGVVSCLDTSRPDAEGEMPVVRWVLGVPVPEQDLGPRFASFADFALTKLRETAEDEGW